MGAALAPRRRRRWLRVALGLGVVLVALVALGALFFDKLVVAALTPRSAFDPAHTPRPPDYADPALWSALPSRDDAADARVAGQPPDNQRAAPVDVFYVHPTSYVGRAWNATLGDATVDRATDRGATRIQASVFNNCCAVYAPRYRQANLTAFLRTTSDGARAIELAGRDVLAAFAYYLEHYNHGRPFIVAAHSQGAVLALRLLREAVAGREPQSRLVAAYLVGSSTTEQAVAALPGIPACDSPTQTGCVVGFNARSASYRGGLDFVENGTNGPRLCVNPLTWRHDGAPAGRESNLGAVFFGSDDSAPAVRPAFASARCREGTLVVEFAGAVPRDFASRLLDYAIGRGNYHPIEFGLFYMNLRANAQARVDAFLARGRVF